MRNLLLQIFLVSTLVACTKTYSEIIEIDVDDPNIVKKTQILLLGTLHFNQFHNPDNATQDFSREVRQEQFEEVATALSAFKPDQVFVGLEASHQSTLDDLYQQASPDFNNVKNGYSEVYQIGFRLGKKNNIEKVIGVGHHEDISKNLFANGTNLEHFGQEVNHFQNTGRSITQEYLEGETSTRKLLIALNKPENIEKSHQLLFNPPAYIQNSNLKSKASVDEKTTGTELLSRFYDRNINIYSNILNKQVETDSNRIVVIVGQVHVGILQDLFSHNPNFEVINANQYLETIYN